MFNTIEEAIQDIKDGKMVIVADDENRENEGDLVMAAQMVTAEDINFMAKYGRGLICMPINEDIARNMNLNLMTDNNTDNHGTAFTVSIDYKDTTTGISAFERALTIQNVINKKSAADDFRKPGHVFPLIAEKGGVLNRKGHTEAAVDLAKLAGLKPAGVIVEIINDDGTMARKQDLMAFAEKHNLKFITIKDLIEYRNNTSFIDEVTVVDMPTKHGDFMMHGFVDSRNGQHHIALVKGNVKGKDNVLTRVHSECLTGDVLGSRRCDCGEQFDAAIKKINDKGEGVLIYMRQEGRGIGLINKLRAYALQDKGYDTVEANEMLGFEADLRSYEVPAAIYRHIGIKSVDIMTNNPSKIKGLEDNGIKIEKRVEIQMNHNERNEFYLKTKQNKLNHMLNY